MNTFFLFLIPISISLIICIVANGYFFYFLWKAMDGFFEKQQRLMKFLVNEAVEEYKINEEDKRSYDD